MKHIELNCDSLAECYAKVRNLLYVSDLGHKAKVVIDIDTNSPFVPTWIEFGAKPTDKFDGKQVKLDEK